MTRNVHTTGKLLAALCFAAVSSAPAVAQAHPEKPVRLIVPYAPGGNADTLARIISQRLGQVLEQQFIKDGSSTPKVEVEYLLGDPRRRKEGLPLLERKFHTSLARVFAPKQQAAIASLIADRERLEMTPVHEFMDLVTK